MRLTFEMWTALLNVPIVAERTKAPLYILSAADLGVDAEHFEQALTDAFECCQLWGAFLLLDEADVFLEARSADNLQRNELVASRDHATPLVLQFQY